MTRSIRSHESPSTETAVGESPAPSDITDADTADVDAIDTDAVETDADETDTDAPDTDAADPEDDGGGGWRGRHPVAARAMGWTVTGLAGVLVLAALEMPNRFGSIRPSAFVRLPVEALLLAGLLLVLPPKARRVVGAVSGLVIALLTVVKFLDIGFYSTLGTRFDLMFDWGLILDGASAFSDSVGHTVAVIAEIGVGILVVALLVLLPLAVIRVSGVMARHSRRTTRALLALAVVWVLCSVLTVRIPGGPVFATRNTAALTYEETQRVRTDIKDMREFKKVAAHDPFAAVPPSRLLTGLRGKNVIFAFIESYGRAAVQDPIIAPGVDAVLNTETARLQKAGYYERSAFLTSATYGAGSWLGHSTFLSGLWINNQSRYRTVTNSSRMSLTAAFERTGAWRTVGVMPGTTKAWPEAKWHGLDHVYTEPHLGYKGPKFSWSPMPDQYALTAFQRLENGQPHDKPLMSEIILTSSHAPWAPIPTTIPWNQVGDGSVYTGIKNAGKSPAQVWKQASQVRAEYGKSIQYSVSNLIDFVLNYTDDNTVLVFLGDHQPASIVSGTKASHDVPVAIVAHDPNVMKQIAGWGWQDGLRPDPKTAPVWKMSSFRDRFLTAYSPQAGLTSPLASAQRPS